MKLDKKWSYLQLFADGGAGAGATGGAPGEAGAAATSGDGSADAAQRLRELGAPENKIQKYNRARQGTRQPEAKPQPPKNPPQAAAANDTKAAQTEETKDSPTEQTPKYDWDEVMKDPECNRRMQETVSKSKKAAKAAEDAMAALAPALKFLAEQNGMDPEKIDYVTLAKSITGEYDDKALELGIPRETVIKMDQQQRTIEQQKTERHIQGLIQQGEAMKQIFPNFDLRAEMQNPTFVRLTSPGVGISVDDAYHLVHRKELEVAQAQVVAKQTQAQVQNAIRAGASRPDESGASSQAPSVTTVDWKHATPEQIREQGRRIRAAAAQGRYLRPGE